MQSNSRNQPTNIKFSFSFFIEQPVLITPLSWQFNVNVEIEISISTNKQLLLQEE